MRRSLNGNVNITSRHGQSTTMGMYGKHLGYDYAGNGMTVVAPEDMTVIGLYSGGSGGYYIEAKGKYTHRFLHLRRHSTWSKFGVSVGQLIKEGQAFAVSNNTGATTGPHLHHDVRKNGTAWNSGFSNFVDWEKLLVAAPTPPSKMPKVGQMINITKGMTRNTYRAGTTTVAGKIYAKDTSYNYTVRGYDSKYPYRILINSASAGGNGVALALYYTNGAKIDGWTQL
jgi:murein DD-endopeptidase MepM/ murein hydrolase activator NlpD